MYFNHKQFLTSAKSVSDCTKLLLIGTSLFSSGVMAGTYTFTNSNISGSGTPTVTLTVDDITLTATQSTGNNIQMDSNYLNFGSSTNTDTWTVSFSAPVSITQFDIGNFSPPADHGNYIFTPDDGTSVSIASNDPELSDQTTTLSPADWDVINSFTMSFANSTDGHSIGLQNVVFTAAVVDNTAPTFDSTNSTPLDNATNVSVSNDIVIDFNENIALGSGNITIRNVTDNSDFAVFSVTANSGGETTSPAPGLVSYTGDKVYLNPASDLTGNRTYAIRIDSGAVTDTATATNDFTGISDDTTYNFSTSNTAPEVDLNSGTGDNDNSVSFSEGNGVVNIASSASVTEADSDTLKTITITLTNDQDGSSEGLNVTAAAQNALTGVSGASDITLQDTISITGATATAAEVATFLQAVTYNNTSSTPNETTRTVTVVINDGSTNSATRTATVSVSNTTAASSSAAAFDTTNGTNLTPAITFSSEDETLTIVDASHTTGSTADGGGGTDILSVPTGTNLANLTSLTNFETLTPDSGASITLTESQHESFTTINGAGTNQFTLSSADGNGVISADSDIETYVLDAAFSITMGSSGQNITGSSGNDTVITGAITATGTLSGGSGTDVLQMANGSNISNATISGFETLTVENNSTITITEVQHDTFSSITGSGTESILIAVANDGFTASSAIEVYYLGQANTVTLGAAGQTIVGSSGNDTIDVGAFTTAGTLNGSSGTDTLSMSSGASIAGATVSNFENLTLASGATVSMTASQPALFGGTIVAAGTETINITGNGDFTTLANVESFSVGNSSTNSRTVTVGDAGTSVTAASSTDAVTFNVGTLTYTGTLTGDGTTADTLSMSSGANISGGSIANIVNLTVVSGASVTMTPVQNAAFTGTITATGSETINISGDGDFTTLNGIENYSVGDDNTNTRTITVTNASATIAATSGTDAITFDIAGSAFNGSLVGDPITGDTVSASDGADVSGGGFTNIGTLSLVSGATVTIDAANVANNFTSAITGAAGSETLKLVDGGTFNFANTSVSEVENLAIGTNSIFNISLTDNFDSNGNAVTISNAFGSAITNAITLNASALSGDTINMTATDFNGNDTISGGSGADTIRPGGGTDSMTGNAGNDNFVGSATDLNGDTIADLSIGDIVTVTGVTGLTTSNVRFNGTSVLQIDTNATDFSAVEISLSLTNAPGNNLGFSVADNNGNTEITFITPNDVPVFSNLNGGGTFVENGSAVVIDSNVLVADTELDALNTGAGNYDGASLTITRNGGANSQDVFGNNGSLGTLTEGNTFTYNAATVGTVTTNSSGTLVLTFNSSATSAIVDSVLQNITYQNSSEAPPASVTLDFTFNDGTANSTGTNQATINITAQNDAPTDISLSNTTVNQSATGAGANIGILSTSDVDTSDSHTYSLVSAGSSASGTCSADTDNASFQINGSILETQAALNGGTYVVCLQTNDATTTFQKAFTITVNDDVAPDAPSTPNLDAGSDTGPSNSDNITNDTTPTLSGTAESGATVTLYSDQVGGGATVIGTGTATGGNWQITTSALTAGLVHGISAKATDADSNESTSSGSLSVTIDTTAPSAPSTPDLSASSDTGSSNTDNITNDTTPTFTGTGTTGDTVTLISNVDGTVGSAVVSGGTWTITSSELTSGAQTISARAMDTAGNTVDSAGLSVTIDTNVSAPTITTPIEGDGKVNAAEDNDVLITGSGADANVTVSVSITDGSATLSQNVTSDGSGNWTISGSEFNVSGFTNGDLTISASQTDNAGNTSSAASTTITLDNAAPSAPSITTPIEGDGLVNAAEDADVLIAGTGAEAGNSVTVTIHDGANSLSRTVTADNTGAWTISGSEFDVSTFNNGTLTVSVSQSDSAGNTSSAASTTITLDNAAPSAPSITTPIEGDGVVNAAEDADVLIAGTGAEAGNNVTVTIHDGANSLSRTVTADNTGAWTIIGSEFDVSTFNNGTLTVSASQSDSVGNTSNAASTTVTLDNAAPSAPSITTPIEGDGLINAAEDADVLIAGTGAEAGNNVTVTIHDGANSLSRTITADNTGAWTISGSEFDVSTFNNGTLTVSVSQSDSAGNTSSAASTTITLDNAVPSAPSITTPIEGDDVVNAAEDADVLIAGTSAEAGASVTVIIDDGANSVSRTVTADNTGAWTISGSEFDVSTFNNGTLTVSASQSDSAGNTSSAASTTITLDNTAPSAPSITTPIEGDGLVNAAEDADVLIAGTGAEAGNSVTVTIDDGANSVNRTVTADNTGAWTISGSEFDVSTFNNGTLTVSTSQSDSAGNTSSAASTTITLDNTAPSAPSITTPIEGDGLVNAAEDADVLIAGTGAEAGNSVTVTVDDGANSSSRTVTADNTGAWTISGSEFDVSTFNNGTLTVSASQSDSAGNTSSAASTTITLDNAAPSAPSITTPIEGDGLVNAAEDADVLIAGTGAEAGNSVTVTIHDGANSLSRTVTADNTGAWTISGSEFDVSTFNNGTLTVSASQSDSAGNTSSAASTTITLDNAAPSAPSITTPIEGDDVVNAAEDADVLIAGTAAEADASVTVTIDDGANSLSRTVTADNTGAWTISGSEFDVSTFNNGTLTVSVSQSDSAGNTSSAASTTITLDNAAPSAPSITTPIEDDDVVNAAEDADVLIAGTGAEADASVTVTIDDGANSLSRTVTADNTGVWTISGSEFDVSTFNNGTLTVSVSQSDSADNTSSAASTTITLDNAAPSAPSITTPIEGDDVVNAAEDADVLIAGTSAEAGASVTVTIDDGANSVSRTVTADNTGAWTISGSEFDVSTFNNGTLTVSASQSDSAGNTSSAASTSITLDNAAPSAPSITTPIEGDGLINAAEDADVLIAGTGAEADARVTVTIHDGANSLSRTVTADNTGAWTISGNEFDVSTFNNGTLTVTATQTDSAGNTSSAANTTITLDNAAPSAPSITTPIAGDGLVNAAEDADVLITGIGAEAGNSVTVTIDDGANSLSRTVTADNTGEWSISGSEFDVSAFNNGTLTVSATQTDSAGNTSSAGSTTITLDNSAPSALSITTPIEGDDLINETEDSDVLIEGSGAEAQNSVTVTIDDGVNSLSRTVTADNNGAWTISGSEFDVSTFTNGTLTVTASQSDASGNTSSSANTTVTLDNSAPEGITASIDQELINADNETSFSFTLTGLESTGSFTYEISDGNTSVTNSSAIEITSTTQQETDIDVTSLGEGTLTLSVIVSDDVGNNSDTVTDTVTKQYNVAPVLSGSPDTSVDEDSVYDFTPTLTDPDSDDTHTYSIVNKPDWAEFDTQTGQLTGTPEDSDVGTTSDIEISVTDGTDSDTLAAFSIEVINTNDAPIGQDVSFTIDEGGSLSKDSENGLLSLASDDDLDSNDSLTVVKDTDPQYGTLTLNADGSFEYIHSGGEDSTDSFTYRVEDSENASSPIYTVTINTTAIEDAPTAVNDTLTTLEDASNSVNVLLNDSDPENNMVASSVTIKTQPTKGQLSVTNGVVTFTPTANANGEDSFTYTVKDSTQAESNEATVSINITPVNDLPVAANFTPNIDEDTAKSALAVRASATDVEDINPTGTITLESQPTIGQAEVDLDNGTITYTPNANETGSDSFTYSILDSEGGKSNIATISVNIGAVNDRPIAANDEVTTEEDTETTLAILANDSDVEDQGFESSAIVLEDKGDGAGNYELADVTVGADGLLNITPKQDQNGMLTFTYTVDDSEGLRSEPAMVTVNITAVNDAPVAEDNTAQLLEDGNIEINVLGNDSDVDSQLNASSVAIVSQPQGGTLQLLASGNIVYTPIANFFGNDAFTYTVQDAEGLVSNLATVNITVTSVNDAPVISGTPLTSASEDEAYSFTPTATDTDNDPLIFSVSSLPIWATFDDITGTISGTPIEGQDGTYSDIVITVSDGQVDASLPAFAITVSPVNDAPSISGTPSANVNQDEDYSFTPTASDVDSENLVFAIENAPVWASFDSTTGSLSGTPVREDVGTYSNIIISVSDGELEASLPAFEIVVAPVNAAPIANNMQRSVLEDGTTSFTADVRDADGDTLTMELVSQPQSGVVQIQGTVFTYTPLPNFNGTDVFTYTVSDNEFKSNTASVTMTVTSVNDVPTAVDDSFTFDAVPSNQYILPVLDNDVDPDGTELRIIGAKASIGSAFIANNTLTYEAVQNTQGPIVVTYLIEDEGKARAKANANITINETGAGSAPTITAPSDLTVDATGLFTKVNLGTAVAVDSSGNSLPVSLVRGTPIFAPGSHIVYWQTSDNEGLQATASQNLNVNPLVSLQKDSRVAEDRSHSIQVYLNGPAPSYPVTVPYTVSGTADSTDHDLQSGEVIINSGTSATISFNIFADGVSEGNETIVVSLDDTLNRGATFSSTITIVEENVAPNLTTAILQNNEERSLITASDEQVTIEAQVSDPNPNDLVSVTWQPDAELVNVSNDPFVFEFNPANIPAGIYKVRVTATDNAQPSLSTSRNVFVEVVPSLAPLTGEDSDGDLIPDDQEGYSDDDEDGIPDFMDAITDCNVIQEQALESNQFLVEGDPGVCLRKGATVPQNNTGGLQLLEEELPSDPSASNAGGIFDFIATGLPQPGDVYSIVLPQRQPIPLNAVYRKLISGEWRDFVTGDGNELLSTTGEPGFCPPPGSNQWTAGLAEGDWCVQLRIVDGGPNDDDGVANGSIVDPGGIAVAVSDNTQPEASPDSVTIVSGQEVVIDVLENDSDADNDTLTITGATVDFGDVTIENNQLRYLPPANFIGDATIQYSVTDSQGGSANSTAVVSIVVNQPPQTVNDTASSNGSELVIDVLANDSDPEGGALSLVAATAEQGTAKVNMDGTLSYKPNSGFEGVDTIVYTVKDEFGATSEGLVSVTVTLKQVTQVENSSSGSMGGMVLLLMSALVIRRRKAVLPAFALVTTSCLLSSQANAADWQLTATAGQSEADSQIASAGLDITAVDDKSNSWSIGAFYELLPSWQVGLRYIDLGQGSVEFSGLSENPEQTQQQLSRVAPVLPEGPALQFNYINTLTGKLSGKAFLGAFNWDYRVNSVRDGRFSTRYEDSGTSGYVGAGLAYQVTSSLSLGVEYSKYFISANDVDDVSLSLSVQF
ncbi:MULTISPECIES: Ig-like domain-containing protein [unclassified Pseudoalteromonas]|uniref:Ig-like domain-containing protein n=1 Tax=unclassified Pseudoalteromonas TaxID=194690 RepID=UPI0030148645